MKKLYGFTENLSALVAVILLMTGALLFSGRADATEKYTCGLGNNPLNSGNAPQIKLHDISLNEADIEKLQPGDVLYTSPQYVISYSCRSDDSTRNYYPVLERLGDFQLGILPSLERSGLGLAIEFNDTIWHVKASGSSQYSPAIGPSYQHATGQQSFIFRIKLYVVQKITKPLRVNFNPSTAFKILSQYGGSGNPGVTIPASGWTLQYIPKCIGKVILPATVNMGRIITGGSDYTNKLVRQANFTVTAKYNDSCSWSGTASPTDLSVFNVKLNINFKPLNMKLGDGEKSILIKNTDGKENGLKLQIQDPFAGTLQYLKFNTPSEFYGLGGDINSYSHTYTAWIRPVTDSSATIIPGKFSVPVAVSIRYY
ncbi:hypothetical protein QNB54_003387 [Salmonella enterica]|nr:hypothetical protein [Salmonella enterica]